MPEIKAMAIALALGILVAWASEMSYRDAKLAEESYRDDVCAGVYPDYKGLAPDCAVKSVAGDRYYP